MEKRKEGSRRDFLKKSTGTLTGLIAAPMIVRASALGLGGATPPSDRITVAINGSGQRAVFETLQYPSFDNVVIVAVCDVVKGHLLDAKDRLEKQYDLNQPNRPNKGIRMYDDFMEVLAQKDIDAVYNVAPDHWHPSMGLRTLKAGKHLHYEKPLGTSVQQDLAVLKGRAKFPHLVVQYGTELRAYPAAKKAIELVANGRIGKVQKIYVVSPASQAGGSATPVLPVPDGFNYDAWLGPAPMKPFCYDRCLRPDRAGIFNIDDYCLGMINNWAAHLLDQMQRWADATGRKDPPVHYEGSGKFPTEGLFNDATQWRVQCKWADGLALDFMDARTYANEPDVPKPVINPPSAGVPNGVVFVGSEGWVLISYGNDGSVFTQPDNLMKSEIGPNEIHVLDSALETIPANLPKGFQQTLTAGHHQNWIKAIRTGSPVVSPIESAFRSDMISQLSNLCIRTGKPVQWDPKKETIVGNDEAKKLIVKPLRDPWGVENVV
ncbi:MAG: Gfo/Idh/MocA family oxidoreductase [Bryobacteraceae bacterium]|jgi:hypothetical protein